MKDPFGLSVASIPIAYVQLLAEIVVERGIRVEQLLVQSRVPPTLLDTPDARVTPRQWSRLVLTAIALTDDAGLGCEYGLRLRPTAHGMLAFAVMSCATLGQALTLAETFFSMRLRDYQMVVRTEGDQALVGVRETHPVLGAAPEQAQLLRRFFHECLMLGIVHAGRFLTGENFAAVMLHVDWPEPPYYARYRTRMPAIVFSQACCQIQFPASLLALPLAMADPAAHQQAVEQCEQELLRRSATITDLIARVKAELILIPHQGYPSLEDVAARLYLSGRTLKRHLHSLGTSYISLLDAVRRQEAESLLRAGEMDIQTIGERLGYLGPANFSRAFKKWTGLTPSQFRLAVNTGDLS